MHIPHHNLRDKRKRVLLSKFIVTKLVDKVICHDITYTSDRHFKGEKEKRRTNSVSLISDGRFLRRRVTLESARVDHHSPGKISFTRIQNRCVLSGRAKAVYRFCRISRIRLRELAGKGLINGVTKSSW